MGYSMSNNVDVNLTLSEEEFRLLSDLVATAANVSANRVFIMSPQLSSSMAVT